MDFGIFWGFWAQFWSKMWIWFAFRPNHQVNPANGPSKDSKTAAVSELATIG